MIKSPRFSIFAEPLSKRTREPLEPAAELQVTRSQVRVGYPTYDHGTVSPAANLGRQQVGEMLNRTGIAIVEPAVVIDYRVLIKCLAAS